MAIGFPLGYAALAADGLDLAKRVELVGAAGSELWESVWRHERMRWKIALGQHTRCVR
jgi:hypothetical protein